LGGTTTITQSERVFFIYTSDECTNYDVGPFEGDCESWFLCNILAMNVFSTFCAFPFSWQWNGVSNIEGTKCNVWIPSEGPVNVNASFYASVDDGTPVLMHWSADNDTFVGVEEFEEWIFFDSFVREHSPLPASTFNIQDIHPQCL